MTSAPLAPTSSPFGRLATIAGDIKLAHSVFALPFAILAAFLARPEGEPFRRFGAKLALVVVCMVLARSWAMVVNRLADRRLDAANPRTARRAFASGRLPASYGVRVLLASAILFLACCSLFGWLFGNWWPLALGAPVLGWIALYSYTKRFTWLCHVFLGGALAASPIAAAIAVDPAALGRVPALWWIAGMVVAWVAGFDVIYALQDLEHDRRVGLRSVPARFGWRGAAWVSRALHGAAAAALLGALAADARLGFLFGMGVGLVAVLLAAEHAVLAKRGRAGLQMAFFTLNGVVSCVLGLAGAADVLGPL